MYCANLRSSDVLSILKGKTKDTFTGVLGDKLDTLNNTIDNNMLDTGVFALSVFANKNSVNVIVGRFVSSDGPAWSDVGKEVECSTESKVE